LSDYLKFSGKIGFHKNIRVKFGCKRPSMRKVIPRDTVTGKATRSNS